MVCKSESLLGLQTVTNGPVNNYLLRGFGWEDVLFSARGLTSTVNIGVRSLTTIRQFMEIFLNMEAAELTTWAFSESMTHPKIIDRNLSWLAFVGSGKESNSSLVTWLIKMPHGDVTLPSPRFTLVFWSASVLSKKVQAACDLRTPTEDSLNRWRTKAKSFEFSLFKTGDFPTNFRASGTVFVSSSWRLK